MIERQQQVYQEAMNRFVGYSDLDNRRNNSTSVVGVRVLLGDVSAISL